MLSDWISTRPTRSALPELGRRERPINRLSHLYIQVYIDSTIFEWEEAKNLGNQKKHGLSFEIAKEVFFDPLASLQPDPVPRDEDRWRIIGKIKNTTVALVVFVVRGRNADTYRLISARRVTSHERRNHEEG